MMRSKVRASFRCLCLLATGLLAHGCTIVQVGVTNPVPCLSKVAVAPFFNLSQEKAVDGRRFALAYFAELQKVPGFQVVPVGVTEQAIFDNDLEMDTPQDALELARILGVDIVVVGAVTDYDPYYPPRVGLQVSWYSPNSMNVPTSLEPSSHEFDSKFSEPVRTERFQTDVACPKVSYHGPARIPAAGTVVRAQTPEVEEGILSDWQPFPLTESPADTGQAAVDEQPAVDVSTVAPLQQESPPDLSATEPQESRKDASTSSPDTMSDAASEVSESVAPRSFPRGGDTAGTDQVVEAPAAEKVRSADPQTSLIGASIETANYNDCDECSGNAFWQEASFWEGSPTPPPTPPVPTPTSSVTPQLSDPPIPAPKARLRQPDPLQPLMSYTRLFDGADADLLARLRDYVELSGDRRSGGWEAYLHRSEDFIRFTTHVMIVEMLTLHGGETRRRFVFKLRKRI